ncbi:hypothetical protein GPECTOR_2g1086 [Gonium pectorale]|uniref:Nuclear cap-binding protein subunit 3 n=1 Tax=Gonium pectorale TaxID=33097 RepID=A0A150H048_GONPE|nr:hypothetical protein GPECTOR_2g1086 [Gonium pectorale]|eukprot:KXZ55537.1 hypothetical protein GPECTOR_2g1086 [Gonium pectorale]
MTDSAEEFGPGPRAQSPDHLPILFSLPQGPNDGARQSALDEEREKHRRRAERFGTQYHDPGRSRRDFKLMMEARKERFRGAPGFTTGDLDLFSQEERDKRAARAARFQLEAPLAPALDSYRPDEELEARARRAVKFGVSYQPTEAVLMDMDLYETRKEVGANVERRPEAVYLYGVDVMSTKEVLSYFSEYGPVFVEWIDDSSCNVLFADGNSAKRAMVAKGTPLPPEVVTQPQQREGQEGSQEQPAVCYQPELPVPDNLADVVNLPYVWHKGRDFVKAGTPISLVYRMATVEDVRDMDAPKRTRELWKSGGRDAGGGRRGRGRGGRGQARLGKRPFRRGDGDGPEDMDVDDDGPGAGMDEDGDVPMKRQRGARGGQRLAFKAVRPALQPYGGKGLLEGAVAGVLPAKGHVLDYTELEDEDPAARPSEEGARPTNGPGWEEGEGGRGHGGRRGRGRRGGRGGGRAMAAAGEDGGYGEKSEGWEAEGGQAAEEDGTWDGGAEGAADAGDGGGGEPGMDE